MIYLKSSIKNFHFFIKGDKPNPDESGCVPRGQNIFNGKFSYAEPPINRDRLFGVYRTINII